MQHLPKKSQHMYKQTFVKILKNFLLIGVLVVTTFFIFEQVDKYQSLLTGASAHNATVFFNPADLNLVPGGTVSLFATVDAPTAFIKTHISFDPTKVALANDPIIKEPDRLRVIRVTPLAEANGSGQITMVLGLKSNKKHTPLEGNFNLATLNFNPLTQEPNALTSVTISPSESQLVSREKEPFQVEVEPAKLILNHIEPTASIAPTTIALSSPTPLPTLAPTSASLPSTPTPTPTLSPTTAPTVRPTLRPTTKPSASVKSTISCASICKSARYAGGSCLPRSRLLASRRSSIYHTEGNIACTSNRFSRLFTPRCYCN